MPDPDFGIGPEDEIEYIDVTRPINPAFFTSRLKDEPFIQSRTYVEVQPSRVNNKNLTQPITENSTLPSPTPTTNSSSIVPNERTEGPPTPIYMVVTHQNRIQCFVNLFMYYVKKISGGGGWPFKSKKKKFSFFNASMLRLRLESDETVKTVKTDETDEIDEIDETKNGKVVLEMIYSGIDGDAAQKILVKKEKKYYITQEEKEERYRDSQPPEFFTVFEPLKMDYKDFLKDFNVNDNGIPHAFPLIIVRHGEAEHNEEDSWHRTEDTSLTETGEQQAREAGRQLVQLLKDRNEILKFIGVSDLVRTHQTAINLIEPFKDSWSTFIETFRYNYSLQYMGTTPVFTVVPCIHEVTSKSAKYFKECDAVVNYMDKSLENFPIGTYPDKIDLDDGKRVTIDWRIYKRFYNFKDNDRRTNSFHQRNLCHDAFNLFSAVNDTVYAVTNLKEAAVRWDEIRKNLPFSSVTKVLRQPRYSYNVNKSRDEKGKQLPLSQPLDYQNQERSTFWERIFGKKTKKTNSPGRPNPEGAVVGGSTKSRKRRRIHKRTIKPIKHRKNKRKTLKKH